MLWGRVFIFCKNAGFLFGVPIGLIQSLCGSKSRLCVFGAYSFGCTHFFVCSQKLQALYRVNKGGPYNMNLFSKKVKFISAICPECNGHLELDSNLETAFCQYCGAQCIVENAPKKARKQGNLEMILGFWERQQALRRQDKQEKQRRVAEDEEKKKAHIKKYWWVYALIGVAFFAFVVTMAILENQGIIS